METATLVQGGGGWGALQTEALGLREGVAVGVREQIRKNFRFLTRLDAFGVVFKLRDSPLIGEISELRPYPENLVY